MKINHEHHVKRIDYTVEVHDSTYSKTVLFDDRDFTEEEIGNMLRRNLTHSNIIICDTETYETVFRSVLEGE